MRFLLAASLFLVLVSACTGVPDEIIQPDDMASLLADIHKGDALVEIEPRDYDNDSLRKQLKQSILMKHGVTQAMVDSSMVWYGRHLPKYVEVYESTIKILENQLADVQKSGGAGSMRQVSIKMDGDSVNMWPGARSARFTSSSPSNNITFSLKNDRNWDRGDVYQLRFKQLGADDNIAYTIVAEYNDGTSEYVTSRPRGEGWQSLRIYLDPSKTASSIYGTISYTPSGDMNTTYLDSITLIRSRGLAGDTINRRGQHSFKFNAH